jgi:hypothetical protein
MGVKDMMDSLNNGDRLQEAPFTPPGLYKMMLLCMSTNPKRRPHFSDLIHNTGAIRGAIAVSPDARMTLSINNRLMDTTHTTSDEAALKHTRQMHLTDQQAVAARGASSDYEIPRDVPLSKVRVQSLQEPGYQYVSSVQSSHRQAKGDASAPLPSLEYEVPLSGVRIRSQQEPGYQYVPGPVSTTASQQRRLQQHQHNPQQQHITPVSEVQVQEEINLVATTAFVGTGAATITNTDYQCVNVRTEIALDGEPHLTDLIPEAGVANYVLASPTPQPDGGGISGGGNVLDAAEHQSTVASYVPMYGARFRQKSTPEDAIGFHACSLEVSMRAINAIHLGCHPLTS